MQGKSPLGTGSQEREPLLPEPARRTFAKKKNGTKKVNQVGQNRWCKRKELPSTTKHLNSKRCEETSQRSDRSGKKKKKVGAKRALGKGVCRCNRIAPYQAGNSSARGEGTILHEVVDREKLTRGSKPDQ